MSQTQQSNKSAEANANKASKVKCLIQQCLNAKLFTRLADSNQPDLQPEFVQIERGVVLFVCFMKDADETDVDNLAKQILNVKLSESLNDPQKLTSILDLPGNILIVPQATLGGKLKGKQFQYHYNISKEKGKEFYDLFVNLCQKYAGEHETWSKSSLKIVNGTYGIKQVYSTETNGPFLHMIEF